MNYEVKVETTDNEEQQMQTEKKEKTEKKEEEKNYSFAADFSAASNGDKLAEARGRYLDEVLTTGMSVIVTASAGTVGGAIAGAVFAKKAEMSNEETLQAAGLGSIIGGHTGVVLGYLGAKAYNAFTR